MPSPKLIPSPVNINGIWHLKRRVPKRFSAYDRRENVRLSTGIHVTADPHALKAKSVVQDLDRQLHAYWTDLKNGVDPATASQFEWARTTVRTYGYSYQDISTLSDTDAVALLKRLMHIHSLPPEAQQRDWPALIGAVKSPKKGPTVENMLTVFEELRQTALKSKSPNQLKRWRTTRKDALAVFCSIVGGSRLIADLTDDDILNYREHWNKRVMADEVQIDTANKMMGYIASMIREINLVHRLKMEDLFAGKQLRGATQNQRDAFSIDHVTNVILAPGALNGLNEEARAIFYVVAELGLRPSEVTGLTPACIHLDESIPNIDILPDGRQLKTKNSKRIVPLLGLALVAMRRFPNGFKKYRDNNDTLSATINKYLTKHQLLEHEGQTFYSLRHTFKDRLRTILGVTSDKEKNEFLNMLMGHDTGFERYGRGYALMKSSEILTQIAWKVPPPAFDEVPPMPQHHAVSGKRVMPSTGGGSQSTPTGP